MSKHSYKKATRQHLDRAHRGIKLLSSKTRFDILWLLRGARDGACVKDIAESIDISHSATSHQLAKLEEAGVVTSIREGQMQCYRLTETPLTHSILNILNECSVD